MKKILILIPLLFACTFLLVNFSESLAVANKINGNSKPQTFYERIIDKKNESLTELENLVSLKPDSKISAILYFHNTKKLSDLNLELSPEQLFYQYSSDLNDYIGGLVLSKDVSYRDNIDILEKKHFNQLERNIKRLKDLLERSQSQEQVNQLSNLIEDLEERYRDEQKHSLDIYAFLVNETPRKIDEYMKAENDIVVVTFEGQTPFSKKEIEMLGGN
jgi:hypothetical protein